MRTVATPCDGMPVPSSTDAVRACAAVVGVRVPATAIAPLPYAVSSADDNESVRGVPSRPSSPTAVTSVRLPGASVTSDACPVFVKTSSAR